MRVVSITLSQEAERAHVPVAEYERIELEIYAVLRVTLYENHRLAAACQFKEYIFVERRVADYLVVPYTLFGIEAFDPYTGAVVAGTYEINVDGIVYERAVGAQRLD